MADWSLGTGYSTAFQVKLDAIGKLATDLCKQNITKTELIIHHPLDPRNCWCPGENESTDKLAKLGSTTPFIGGEPALPHPQCCIVSAVWQKATAVHARVWGMVQTAQFTLGLLPAPNKKLSSNLLAFNRARIRVVTRMLTLHNALNDHMCRIGRRHSHLCSKFEEGCKTPCFFFENCATLAAIKCLNFGTITTILEEVVHNRRLTSCWSLSSMLVTFLMVATYYWEISTHSPWGRFTLTWQKFLPIRYPSPQANSLPFVWETSLWNFSAPSY